MLLLEPPAITAAMLRVSEGGAGGNYVLRAVRLQMNAKMFEANTKHSQDGCRRGKSKCKVQLNCAQDE